MISIRGWAASPAALTRRAFAATCGIGFAAGSLPLPWWGPVLAPVCIALLMIVWGTLVSQRSAPPRASVASMWVLASIGIVLALYTFMADAIHVAHLGVDATRMVLPTTFKWSVFVVALALMAAPVAHMTRDSVD